MKERAVAVYSHRQQQQQRHPNLKGNETKVACFVLLRAQPTAVKKKRCLAA